MAKFRTDKAGIVHCSVGSADFDADKLKDNLIAVVRDIRKAKPSTSKGIYIKKVTLSSTMGPGLRVDLSARCRNNGLGASAAALSAAPTILKRGVKATPSRPYGIGTLASGAGDVKGRKAAYADGAKHRKGGLSRKAAALSWK